MSRMMTNLDPFWGCAHVLSSQERRAVEGLRRQGFRAMFPFFLERRVIGPPVPQALFPGYVFILLEVGLPWGAINNTRGVIRLLASSEGVPQHLDAGFAESLQRCLVPSPDPWGYLIPPGSVVLVKRGVMATRRAIVKWSREQRLGLLFSLFSREVEVELSIEDVEVIEG